MRVALRVDAAAHIGIGHFMRCLTLADALTERGASARFLSRHLPLHLRDLLAEKGYACTILDGAAQAAAEGDARVPHAHWLGTKQEADACDSLRALGGERTDWLVVDHYALDARWERQLRQASSRILAIDDVADRTHECDILLDQNLYPNPHARYTGRVPTQCRLLLGPAFALLRPEFRRLRAVTPVREGHISTILVSLGGADASNQTEKVVRAITQLSAPLAVDVVIGTEHRARAIIEDLCRAHGFRCHVQSRELAHLMARADLAIGAAGSTSWERCCLGTPTVCITDADNQVPIAAGLAERGAVVNLGAGANLSEGDIVVALRSLLDDPDRVRSLSAAAHDLVDGQGVERVCETLELVA